MATRTTYAKKNIIMGLLKQCVSILAPFITRTVFIYTLGSTYQGLSSLFTSVIHVLNLADVGFSSAVIYILYKPIADNNYKVINAIVYFLKRVYIIVGLVILITGIIMVPFLSTFVKGAIPEDINLYYVFLLTLLNTVISYFFFAYKSALLTAMQREDVLSKIQILTNLLLRITQVVILIVSKNYYLFLAAFSFYTLINNILIQLSSKKLFPEIIPQGKMPADYKAVFNKQIKGLIINKFSDTARNSLDSIIISSFIGLVAVAAYDNYYYVYSSLYAVTLTVTRAVQASVGNSIAIESIEKNYKDIKKFTFIFMWFIGLCTVCLCCLYQPFMHIWMKGKPELWLDDKDMMLFCVYFFAISTTNVRDLYISGRGLFWELRTWYVVETIANLILNILLGKLLGITGVILATIITISVFDYYCRTKVLFKEYFEVSPKEYNVNLLVYSFVTLLACSITYSICSFIPFKGIIVFIFRFIICVTLPNIVFILCYRNNAEYLEAKGFMKQLIKTRS